MRTVFAIPPFARRSGILAGSVLAAMVLSAQPTVAQSESCTGEGCAAGPHGKMLDDSSAESITIGENTERETPADEGSIPFQISVDGETIDESGKPERKPDGPRKPVDEQRRTDVGLSAVDIQVKFDGLEAEPILNVSTVPLGRVYGPGEPVRFLATSNYPGFIARSEIRIYEAGEEGANRPVAVIPAPINGEASWTMPAAGEREYSYVLRVYDSYGRFDETVPLTIARSRADFQSTQAEATAPGMGDDRTAFRNIPISGGAVTVYGRNIPPDYTVEAFGEEIPLDPDQAFVAQRILPSGDHEVEVSVENAVDKSGLHFSRDINIPSNDWFYVGLADITVGKRMGDNQIEMVRQGEYDKIYSKGRLAFYLKGKIKGEYLLTAAADTEEDDLDDLFKDLDAKDTRRLLRRLDPDDYYPVYGDDSSLVEDAPTKGKFYVRLERGDSHVMWGNFKTRITGTEFMRSERGLYGASAAYRSQDVTSFGEHETEVSLYASQPDTLPQREQFLATGGSAYFLKRQDILEGSETITIEIRDAVSGRVLSRSYLTYGEDYTIDYLQGVLLLKQPLSSTTGSSEPVRDGALGGDDIYLVAQYEYLPAADDLDGYSYGGRAQQWLGESVRIGITGMSETTGEADQRALGADILLRHSESTYLEAEFTRSKGPGFGLYNSTDGGLTVIDQDTAGRKGRTADAWRVQGQVALEDLTDNGMEGTLGGYYEKKEAGFSTLVEETLVGKRTWGAYADLNLTDYVTLGLTYDDYKDDAGQIRRDGKSSLAWEINERWRIAAGAGYTEWKSPVAIASGKSGYDGRRIDSGLRVDYRWDEDHKVYAFGQGTVERSGDIRRNDRGGVGAEVQVTEKVGVSGEVSYGTLGIGALATIDYRPTADDHYYIGYRLDPDRSFDPESAYDLFRSDKGAVVAGVKRQFGEEVAAYGENSYDMFGRRHTLTQAYGVVYTPDPLWTIDGAVEMGRVRDTTVDDDTGFQPSDFDRYAPSLALSYNDEEAGINARLRGEVRIEDSKDGTRDQNSYFFAGGVLWKTSENWRLLANVDAVVSHATSPDTAFRDTNYIEASLGYAYRPILNDRLNALFKYSWLYDVPGNDQLISGATGDYFAPAQRSHIVSVDSTYDLTPWLSVGGKYGFRYGAVRLADPDGTGFEDAWQRSTAHLGILRSDLHVVSNWDVLLEGRVLHMPEADTTDYGALTAIYRHVGQNFKIGVGYNFGRFSDDLRDLTLDDGGVFVNVVGKF